MKLHTGFIYALLALVTAFSACDNGSKDAKKGPKMIVKATNIAKYTAKKMEGDDVYKKDAYDNTFMTQLTFYTKKGQLEKKSWSDLDQKVVFLQENGMDANGFLETGMLKGGKHQVLDRYVFRVNDKGLKTGKKTTESGGKVKKEELFTYDDNDHLIKEVIKNGKGEVTETVVYKNNEKGDPLEMSIEYPNAEAHTETYDYKEFNKYGDWTKRYIAVDGEVTHIMDRNVYYHNEKRAKGQ